MSEPRAPHAAKLVIGLFMRQRELITPVAGDLAACFGAIDMVSPWFDFAGTNYYETEMGSPLSRRLVVFKDLIRQDALADIKRQTNAIEGRYGREGCRRVNIDPGYLLRERFVLATGKNFAHRIYIGQGIYADLTLIYRNGGFEPLAWTYPDYAGEAMRGYLERVRKKYIEDFKAVKNTREQDAGHPGKEAPR
ncbi:MAG: DUF4416 family protein [Desulfobacterales bacterium]